MLGVPIEDDPRDALLAQVWEASGNVAFYRQLVQQLPTHPTPPQRETVVGGPEDGAVEYIPSEPGVYGPTFHVSGIPTGESKPHVLVGLYNDERKHLASVCALALKAGCEERRVQIAEHQGQLLAQVIKNVLTDLGVINDPKAPAIVRKHLTLVAGAA